MNSKNETVNTISNMGIYGAYSIIGANYKFLKDKFDMNVNDVYKVWSDRFEMVYLS